MRKNIFPIFEKNKFIQIWYVLYTLDTLNMYNWHVPSICNIFNYLINEE